MNIVLIGFRCAGKSTVGRIVSERLGMKFRDTDQLIQERAGMSIAEIVKTGGWTRFRRLEEVAVGLVSAEKDLVAATGGGVVTSGRNVRLLRDSGLVFWLRIGPETARIRMSRQEEASIRPAISGPSPIEEAGRVLKERDPLYHRAAHYRVDADLLDPEAAACAVIEGFRKMKGVE
ncbi:MAG: shikimate kinase [Desulfobacteraceae bacterium]